MKTKNNTIAYAWAMLTVTLWASAFPCVKYCLNFYSPESIMLFRFIIATLTLLLIAVVKKASIPKRKDIPYFIAGGTIGIFFYMWLFNTGTNMLASGVSSFIIASSPVFSLLLTRLFVNEKISAQTIIGAIVSAIGLVLIAISQVRGFTLNIGVLILICAAICTSAYAIIQRKVSESYTAIEATTYSVAFATILMFVFTPNLIKEFPNAPIFANVVIIFMGIFPGAIAYLAWNIAIGRAEKISTLTNFLYLVPFIATALAFLTLGETVSTLAFIGGIIIILGMVIANRNSRTSGC